MYLICINRRQTRPPLHPSTSVTLIQFMLFDLYIQRRRFISCISPTHPSSVATFFLFLQHTAKEMVGINEKRKQRIQFHFPISISKKKVPKQDRLSSSVPWKMSRRKLKPYSLRFFFCSVFFFLYFIIFSCISQCWWQCRWRGGGSSSSAFVSLSIFIFNKHNLILKLKPFFLSCLLSAPIWIFCCCCCCWHLLVRTLKQKFIYFFLYV